MIEHHDVNALALVEGDITVSYGELRNQVAAMRSHLNKTGIVAGDHVALVCGNELHFVVATLGVLGVGAVVAPVLPFGPLRELERKLDAIKPAAVVVGSLGKDIDELSRQVTAPVIKMTEMSQASPAAAPPVVERPSSALAFLLSTSGVAASPKVAMLSHGNMAAAQIPLVGDGPQQITSNDSALGVLPFSHILGLNVVLLATLRAGGSVVIQPRFDVDESLRLITEHQITMLVGAPPMWQRWAGTDAPADAMQSVRFARSGAASLRLEVHERIRDHFGIEIVQGYGLTETASVVASGRGLDLRVTSVGKPVAGLDVLLVDDQGQSAELGDTGEIAVRGPSVFQGYLDDADATASVLTPDGWLWTGDIGVFDDDGYLYIVDRIKDVIIVSGFNVYPAEIENVLMTHPAVRAALVVGQAHGATGETVEAYVSGDIDVGELDAFARSHLSKYKCPTEYHVVDQVPATQTGKKLRRQMRQ